jgi:hypothetical protein
VFPAIGASRRIVALKKQVHDLEKEKDHWKKMYEECSTLLKSVEDELTNQKKTVVRLRRRKEHTEDSLVDLIAGYVEESRGMNRVLPTVAFFGKQDDGTVVVPPTPELNTLPFGEEVELLIKVS